ncbi:MAG: recombinase family protein [Chloroflexi bacterium]|nr:recombinase family protein [Chloroflexota bacterium]
MTAKTPAYGYEFVDSQGKPRTDPTSKWRKETYYTIHPEENQIMVRIYEALAYRGVTLYELANKLNTEDIPPPKSSSEWEPTLLSKLIKNTVYKGEFVSHRWHYQKIRSKRTDKIVIKKIERPKEEWIVVSVPETVPPDIWELANEVVRKNRGVSKRNLHYDVLLANLLKCATCGHAYTFRGREIHKNGHAWFISCYICASRHRTKQTQAKIGCDQSQISARQLDQAVWHVICKILLEPELLAEAMDRYYFDQGMDKICQQIEYIDQQLEDCDREDDKLYKAYLAEVFDEQEFAAKRRLLKDRKGSLGEERRKLQGMLISREQFEHKKRQILALSEQVNAGSKELDLPFEQKRRLVKSVVDEVQLDVNNGQFTILGAIKGAYTLQNGTFVSIPAGRGSNKCGLLLSFQVVSDIEGTFVVAVDGLG